MWHTSQVHPGSAVRRGSASVEQLAQSVDSVARRCCLERDEDLLYRPAGLHDDEPLAPHLVDIERSVITSRAGDQRRILLDEQRMQLRSDLQNHKPTHLRCLTYGRRSPTSLCAVPAASG